MKSASMDETVLGHLADISWFGLAREAEANGMQTAVKMSADAYQSVHTGSGRQGEGTTAWLARSIEANPSNLYRVLAMDPQHFAAMLRRWGDHTKNGGAVAELTEDEIRSIQVPVLITAGDDMIHPRESAIWLAQHLAESEMSTISELGLTTAEKWWAVLLPEIDDFLGRTLPG